MIMFIFRMLGDMMLRKESLKKQQKKVNTPSIDVTPLMAAYFLGYMKSEKGEKISDEDIEKLYVGACLSMGINPVEDIAEFFNELFNPSPSRDADLENSYYC